LPEVLLIEGPASRRTRLFRERAAARLGLVTLTPASAAGEVNAASLADAVIVLGPGASISALPAEAKLRMIQLLECANPSADALALRSRGITLANVSAALAPAVAEFAVALMLIAPASAAPPADRGAVVRALSGSAPVTGLRGKTIGIIGLGRVGESVARWLKPLGATVCYADIRTAPQGAAAGLQLRRVTLDRLLATSDIVTVHVPWGPTASPLLRARELGLMAPGSTLVCTSDQRVIDLAALARALSAGAPGRAALDIGPSEPAGQEDLDRLAHAPNTLITRGLASASIGLDTAAADYAVANVERVIAGRPPESLVEVPNYPRAGDPAFWSSMMYPRRR
jgi:phosphoglycerate dehydrogenase-like enzyme